MKLILLLLLIGLFAGCGRKPDSQPLSLPPSAQDSADGSSKSASIPATDSVGAAPRQPSAAPVIAPQTADPTELAAALNELTQVLRKYSFEHQRLPKTFSEVVAAGYLKNMPQAPPGKKFEIDPKTVQVVLVKQ